MSITSSVNINLSVASEAREALICRFVELKRRSNYAWLLCIEYTRDVKITDSTFGHKNVILFIISIGYISTYVYIKNFISTYVYMMGFVFFKSMARQTGE
jgi:hypothetical protein